MGQRVYLAAIEVRTHPERKKGSSRDHQKARGGQG